MNDLSPLEAAGGPIGPAAPPALDWRPWWTDVLFVAALLAVVAWNLLVPLTIAAVGAPGLVPTSHSGGLALDGQALVLRCAARSHLVALGVGVVALVAVMSYLVVRRRGCQRGSPLGCRTGSARANQFVLWTWLFGAALAPATWALVLIGVSP